MVELIALIIMICIFATPIIITNHKVDHYDHTKIDYVKLKKDEINGVGVYERRRRYANGDYDKN